MYPKLTLWVTLASALAPSLILGVGSASPRGLAFGEAVASNAVVKRADGAERLYAPRAPWSAQNPAFAPDGQTLLFTQFRNHYDNGRAGIYRLALRNRVPVRVLDEPGQMSVNLPGASWNGATNRITFASDRQDTDEIWTSAADGSNLFRVTHHTASAFYIEPSFSPDGQWIVFEVDEDVPDPQPRGSIWKVRADGTALTQLTAGPGGGTDDREPNWSPAGDRIVFQRRVRGADDWYLFTMALDGSDVQQITFGGGDTDASWSPDGKWVVYSSDVGGLRVPNIFVVSAQGGAPIRVTRQNTHADSAPAWSPNGKWIAFESHPGTGAKPASLWRIAAPKLANATATPSPVETHTATPTPTPTATHTATPTPGGMWIPAPVTSWQLQFSGVLDLSLNVQMYDIDMFDNSANVVASLHAQGRRVACYINVGSWEDWRPDANQFPPEVLGNDYAGWPGEKWLDIRRIDLLAPIMRARFDLCKQKGFDAVEPDNLDGYTQNTGFPLTHQDQLNYNKWLAAEAHARGLSIGLKNDLEQVNELLPYFDWALNESCFYYQECGLLQPFLDAGKAVFEIEYTDMGMTLSRFCAQANALNINAILKRRDLDAWRQACR